VGDADTGQPPQDLASRRRSVRGDRPVGCGVELPGLDEHGGEEIVYVLAGTFTDQFS